MNGSDDSAGERFAEHVLAFVRTLRAAGLKLGPGDSIAAMEVSALVGIADREDLGRALEAALVRSPQDIPLFRQAFAVFFRDPTLLLRLDELTRADQTLATQESHEPALRRLAQAMDAAGLCRSRPETERRRETDGERTASALEVLRRKDFEQMTLEEQGMARAMLREVALPLAPLKSRRFAIHPRGRRPDLRATLRTSLRQGGEFVELKRRRRHRRPPPLVILCDISGSMSRYTRMFLHFAHALTCRRDRVHTFLFGTRLTAVTRRLQDRDPDRALALIASDIADWDGGTRIASSLRTFNRDWGRRVLGQGAVVLLLTDGLERDASAELGVEMERLSMSSRRLIWLNPLLRYEEFEPLARGMKMMLPYVDDLVPVHNIESLADLAARLSVSLHDRRMVA